MHYFSAKSVIRHLIKRNPLHQEFADQGMTEFVGRYSPGQTITPTIPNVPGRIQEVNFFIVKNPHKEKPRIQITRAISLG